MDYFQDKEPFKESSTRDHLLQYDSNSSFDEFTILAQRNKKHLHESKESF